MNCKGFARNSPYPNLRKGTDDLFRGRIVESQNFGSADAASET